MAETCKVGRISLDDMCKLRVKDLLVVCALGWLFGVMFGVCLANIVLEPCDQSVVEPDAPGGGRTDSEDTP